MFYTISIYTTAMSDTNSTNNTNNIQTRNSTQYGQPPLRPQQSPLDNVSLDNVSLDNVEHNWRHRFNDIVASMVILDETMFVDNFSSVNDDTNAAATNTTNDTQQLGRYFSILGRTSGFDVSRVGGSNYHKQCAIKEAKINTDAHVYTCIHCLEEFVNRNTYIEHMKNCLKDDTKNECPICLNRMCSLSTLHKCYKCSNTIGCSDCINTMLVKNGKPMKSPHGATTNKKDYIYCGMKCPFCRASQHIPLKISNNDNKRRSEIILHSINNLIKENQKRKTLDKAQLIELIDALSM